MSLANIYALPEFAPIVHQFQLGNLIKVALRSDYVKHTRLLQVNLNFEDFSDFSCEFGDLSSTLSQSDLHADLLSGAISAGKQVASNASYWDRGTDTATSTDLKITQGLLDAVTAIKSIDGTQGAIIDKYGIRLYPTKMIKLKEPIYIIEMSTSEFQLVSFYLELEKRKPIMNVEIDAKLKGEKQ